MMYLTIAVLCSVAVSVLLKILRQQNIDIRQTIVAGYPVAFLLTWLLLKPDISGLISLAVHGVLLLRLGYCSQRYLLFSVARLRLSAWLPLMLPNAYR